MEIVASKKFARFLLVFALIAFLLVAFFGISQSMGMGKQNNGKMDGCIFTGKVEICTMTFSEHISHWQSLFTATTPQNSLALVLLILLAVVFVVIAIFKRNLLLLFNYYTARWRFYVRNNPELSLFDPIKEAFSQGILNPKIYEPARI